jgi:hypothetical protein
MNPTTQQFLLYETNLQADRMGKKFDCVDIANRKCLCRLVVPPTFLATQIGSQLPTYTICVHVKKWTDTTGVSQDATP